MDFFPHPTHSMSRKNHYVHFFFHILGATFHLDKKNSVQTRQNMHDICSSLLSCVYWNQGLNLSCVSEALQMQMQS